MAIDVQQQLAGGRESTIADDCSVHNCCCSTHFSCAARLYSYQHIFCLVWGTKGLILFVYSSIWFLAAFLEQCEKARACSPAMCIYIFISTNAGGSSPSKCVHAQTKHPFCLSRRFVGNRPKATIVLLGRSKTTESMPAGGNTERL